MSLLQLKTQVTATNSLFAAAGSGGGGGGGGQNLTVSTILMEGSTTPLTITLPANANDGFEVRQGGATGVVAIATIDAANGGSAEVGARTLSTISGNAVIRDRLELAVAPGVDTGMLSYTLDTVGAGNASTIGSITFAPGTAPDAGSVKIAAETGAAGPISLTVANGAVVAAPSGSDLVNRKAAVASGGNIYVPAAGTSQNIAQFSTIAGHRYELAIPQLRVQNQPAGVPTAGAWSQLVIADATPISYLDTFDMASVSTIANDFQKCPVYTFVASGTGHTLSANASLSGALSTAITISPAQIYLRDMGIPSGMPTVG